MARRRQNTEEHENLERWMVSYADFVTLLFAFFVVMYAISSVNEGKYKELSAAVISAFRDGSITPTVLQQTGQAANSMVAIEDPKTIAEHVKSNTEIERQERIARLNRALLAALDPLVKTGQVKVTQDKFSIAVEINDSALFESGRALPRGMSADILGQVGQILANDDHPVRVEGFSDNIPISTALYPSNWELSAARAGSIVRLFQESGVPPARLVAIGRAETRPISDNQTAEGRAKNRRVAISILLDRRNDSSVPIDALSSVDRSE
ncbi:MAG: flagellar motor protein MotD [Aquaspirillum sp.]|uniref:flagellar motor protein MotD n=1 Tax=Aquaspirillum serpens TaxID=190 RepID=UPI0003B7588E|nr:flagellar motor protein MotD [Aquaspirillum serpens]MBP7970910.1 flagellar motor protein MotD [Aquaspirillum sp.]